MADNTKKPKPRTPEESRRMEQRRRRQKELKRRKRKRMLTMVLIIAALVVIFVLLGVLLYKLLDGGTKKISAAGDTYVIAIDAGHGGEDLGMSSESSYEKDIDLAICEKLQIMLESQGYEVVMLRSDDSYLSKDERVVLANKSGADLLVSVHCNYSESDSELCGVTATYSKGDKAAKTLAGNIVDKIVQESGAESLGASAGEYTILEDTDMTAVLVEVGYLSNASESASLEDDSYENDIAKGIAYGILASLAD